MFFTENLLLKIFRGFYLTSQFVIFPIDGEVCIFKLYLFVSILVPPKRCVLVHQRHHQCDEIAPHHVQPDSGGTRDEPPEQNCYRLVEGKSEHKQYCRNEHTEPIQPWLV